MNRAGSLPSGNTESLVLEPQYSAPSAVIGKGCVSLEAHHRVFIWKAAVQSHPDMQQGFVSMSRPLLF